MRGLGRIYPREELIELIVPILKKYNVKSATLFGSYAKGTMDERSDIDLVVDSDLQGLDFIAILSDLFDIFGYGNVDLYAWYELDEDTELYKDIVRTGVKIYDAE